MSFTSLKDEITRYNTLTVIIMERALPVQALIIWASIGWKSSKKSYAFNITLRFLKSIERDFIPLIKPLSPTTPEMSCIPSCDT